MVVNKYVQELEMGDVNQQSQLVRMPSANHIRSAIFQLSSSHSNLNEISANEPLTEFTKESRSRKISFREFALVMFKLMLEFNP